MRVAAMGFVKDIHWLVTPSDPLLAPLQKLPGWSIVHPLTPLTPRKPLRQFPAGHGRTTVSRPVLHCVVPAAETSEKVETRILEEMKRLIMRLRHVSKQATLPRGDDMSCFTILEVAEL